jgi:signal transduction histidine kinase/ActR/RegA family two-component response regulator
VTEHDPHRSAHRSHEGRVLWDMLDARASLTRQVILLLLFSTSSALVLDLLFAESIPFVFYMAGFVPFLGIYIAGYLFVRQGKLRLATLLVIVGTVLGQVGVGYYVQGHEAQALVSCLNLVLIAGFVVGPVAALLASVVAMVCVTAYFLLAAAGELPKAELVTGVKGAAVALSTTIFTTGGLVFIAIRHVRSALMQERRAVNQARETLDALEQANFDLDYRAQLAEELVAVGRKLIDTGRPDELARRLCSALVETLDLDRAWIVGRGGAVLGRFATERERHLSSPCEGVGSFPIELTGSVQVHRLTEVERSALSAWTGLAGLDEGLAVLIPGNEDVHLVAAGPPLTCATEASAAFCTAGAGLFASGLARTSAEERLRQAQRMDAVGRLSAGLAHDFNNLLTEIMTGTDLVKSRMERSVPVDEQIQGIVAATQRAANLTKRLMAFTSVKQRPPEVVELTGLVRGMLTMLERTMEPRISLTTDLSDGPLWVSADPVEIERAILNLVMNARDAIREAGTVAVSVHRAETTLDESVGEVPTATLRVQDDGEGMSAEVERRIFEPFFTTRAEQGGHGLGLSGLYGLAKRSGGEVKVQSRPNEGACFDVIFPLVPVDVDRAPPLAPVSRCRLVSAQILIVEDSEDVRSLLTEVLTDKEYRVLTAADGSDALEVLERHDDVQLVVSDVVMPRLGGVELTEVIRGRYPHLPVILMSGYGPGAADLKGVARLHKPFTIVELLSAVSAALSTAKESSNSLSS